MTEDKGTSKGLASALCSVTLISVAQLAMKWGMMSLNFATTDFFSLSAIAEFFVLESAPLLAIFFGLVCYALSMFFWLLTLKRYP
ncbi:hypothetical protein [Veronia pacifica]|uniref:hypothetical protein n=1 Tax=Veronia pacifica TaxID=1080227 RepID=UPI0009F6601A|nr:hypothetical protein [Veronia pacifica]